MKMKCTALRDSHVPAMLASVSRRYTLRISGAKLATKRSANGLYLVKLDGSCEGLPNRLKSLLSEKKAHFFARHQGLASRSSSSSGSCAGSTWCCTTASRNVPHGTIDSLDCWCGVSWLTMLVLYTFRMAYTISPASGDEEPADSRIDLPVARMRGNVAEAMGSSSDSSSRQR